MMINDDVGVDDDDDDGIILWAVECSQVIEYDYWWDTIKIMSSNHQLCQSI